jgi:AGZA family xanthine/uracil permease-like MFS transporter
MLERYFEFQRLGTSWRTELLAGCTTFFTMAYIVFVNPSILRDAGMPFQGVLAATCLSAAFGSVLMGALAKYPIALAPGMGLNAYFTYTVVVGMGVPWQTALGAVFLSGLAFLVLTLTGASRAIVSAIPAELYAAVAGGIGLFIAFIGLRNAGIIVASPATLVQLGNLRDPNTLLAVFGLIVTAGLQARGVRAAMMLGILATTAVGAMSGLISWAPQTHGFGDWGATFGKLDVVAASKLGLLEVVFVFLFVDVFDNVGTLVGVTKKAGIDAGPRLKRILIADASATMVGAVAGTSTVVSYIESASGVVAGGRSGVTAIVTGLLFVVALFVAPWIGAVPQAATAPALIVVGSLMMSHVGEIPWANAAVAIPAFLTILTIPLTFSIATGLSFGFIAYALLKLIRGEFRKQDWLIYLLAALFIARFVYLGRA